MVVVGADVHKRTHTFVAVDAVGRKLGEMVVKATGEGHRDAVVWVRERFGGEVVWGVEDCRHLSARVVPPKSWRVSYAASGSDSASLIS